MISPEQLKQANKLFLQRNLYKRANDSLFSIIEQKSLALENRKSYISNLEKQIEAAEGLEEVNMLIMQDMQENLNYYKQEIKRQKNIKWLIGLGGLLLAGILIAS